MAELIKPWNDDSGDTFTVIYNPQGGEATITSMPNYGKERTSIIIIRSTEESVGVALHQYSCGSEFSNEVKLTRWYENDVLIKCIVFIDKDGTPCKINIKRV